MGAASSVSDELSGTGVVRGLLLRVCVTSVTSSSGESSANLDQGRSGREAWHSSLLGAI